MCDRNPALRAHLLDKGCETEYASLEDCLARTERDWRACREQMYKFKACFEAVTKEARSSSKPAASAGAAAAGAGKKNKV